MKCILSFLLLVFCSRNQINIKGGNSHSKIKIKQKSGERINWHKNLFAVLMASLRTAKLPSNWYVYGDSEMALLGLTINACRVERAKTHKDYGER